MYVLKYNSAIDNVYWCMYIANIYICVYLYIYVYMFLCVCLYCIQVIYVQCICHVLHTYVVVSIYYINNIK